MNSAILRGFLIGFGFLVAMLFAASIPGSDPLVVIGVLAAILLLVFVGIAPSLSVAFCITLSAFTGKTKFGLGYWEAMAAILVVLYTGRMLMGFRSGLKVKAKITMVSISIICITLLLNSFVSAAGGQVGGRRLALLAVCVLMFSYLMLTRNIPLNHLPWIPWLALIPSIIIASFDIINILIPAALPLTYALYDAQNWEIMAQFAGEEVGMLRISGFRELGSMLALLCFAYFGCGVGRRSKYLFLQLLGGGVGAVLTALAGYRSFVLRVAFGFLIAAWMRSVKWFVGCIIAGFFLVGALVVVQASIAPLPLPMQRALCFIPFVDWDSQIKSSAMSGLDWRKEIREIYFEKFFPSSWVSRLLGRGQVVDTNVQSSYAMMKYNPALQTEYFALVQMYHSGFVSTLDFVGILGFIGMVVGCFRAYYICFYLTKWKIYVKPWHLWSYTLFAVATPLFWYTGFFEREFTFYGTMFCVLELAFEEVEASVKRGAGGGGHAVLPPENIVDVSSFGRSRR